MFHLSQWWLNTSAVDPHHDGEIVSFGGRRHPYVQVEAVFAHLSVWVPHLAALEAGECLVNILVAGVGVRVGLVQSGPRTLGDGRTETPLPYWRLSEGNTQEGFDVAAVGDG